VFAAAKEQLTCLLRSVFYWRKGAALMAAIAKGLFLRFSAGAPEIAFPFGDFDGKRTLLGDYGDFI
jgi:hypothetical protein